MNGWKTRAARVTIFLPATSGTKSLSIAGLFHTTLDQRVEKPALGHVTEIGSFGGGQITMNRTDERVDFNWQPAPSDDDVGDLGPPAEVAMSLIAPLRAWLTSQETVLRVAVGLSVGIPVENEQEAVGILSKYIPGLNLGPKTTTDVAVQVNRTRDVSINDNKIRLNLLAKWGMGHYMRNVLEMSGNGLAVSTGMVKFDAACELDLSSPAEQLGITLTGAQAFSTLTTLAVLSTERLENGEN